MSGGVDGTGDEELTKFVVADAADFVMQEAQPGGYDVIVNDVYDRHGIMPPRLKAGGCHLSRITLFSAQPGHLRATLQDNLRVVAWVHVDG